MIFFLWRDKMAAVELYKADGTTSGAFYCSVCNVIYPTKDKAEWCHGERLCACGKKIEQRFFEIRCEECKRKMWHEKEAAKEAERFEKATKIKASDYTGDHVMDGDNYYDSVEDAIDQYEEGQEPERPPPPPLRLTCSQVRWLALLETIIDPPPGTGVKSNHKTG